MELSTTPLAEDGLKTSRRERRKQEVRGKIREAAIELFDQDGYSATNVEEICEKADVAYKTFFNHFPAKQDLLRAIAEDRLEYLLNMIEEIRGSEATTVNRIKAFFDEVALRSEEAGPMRRELLTEIIHAAHDSGTQPKQARLLHSAFGSLLKDGVKAGEIPTDHHIDALTEVVVGLFYSLMFSWANLDNFPLKKRSRAAARFLSQAIVQGKEN